MKRGILILIVVALCGPVQRTIAQTAPLNPESLINDLAGSRATGNERLSTRLPAHVAKARAELITLGTAAFPALIAHRQDQRYSHTIGGKGLLNYGPGRAVRIDKSVGKTCIEILAVQFDEDHEYQGCVNYIPDVVPEKDLPEWWSARSSKSLAELRKEALEQTIAEERRRGRQDNDQLAKDRADELEADLRAMHSNEKQPAKSRQPQSPARPGGASPGRAVN